MSSISIYEEKLNKLIEQFNPYLWGDIRRYIESIITRECTQIYKQRGWLQPQNNDFRGVRDEAIRTCYKKIKKGIPNALRKTDESICEEANEIALYSLLDRKKTSRQQDPLWQRRRLRKETRREVASWLYNAGATKNYTTDFSRRLSKDMKKRNDKTLEKRYIITDDGKIMTMKAIADKALTNMHNENIAISCDMIKLAKERSWRPHFITLTCAAYRRQYTPDINHTFMQQQWSRMRSYLNEHEIKAGDDYMGMRCEEPHKDQTPHRHLVIFCNDETWENIAKAFTIYYLDADAGSEKGAKIYRVKFDEPEDDDMQKAAFYCLKYTFKNASDITVSNHDESNNTAASCKAWRQDWNIRAFQFFGHGTKTLFRYCRNRNYDADTSLEIVRAAQAGDWFTFMQEFYRLKVNIKTIAVMVKNKYQETVKKIIGYSSNNINIVIKVRSTTIHYNSNIDDDITVIITEPRGSKARSEPIAKTVDPPPPDLIMVLS